MRQLLIVLSILILGSTHTSAQDIKVLTYNIYHGEHPGQPGKPNLKEIADLIKTLQPDVVALQEVDSMTLRSAGIYGEKVDLVQKLAEMTGYQGYFAKAMDFSNGGYGEGILIKNGSHFQTQNLSLPAGGEPRAAVWGDLMLNSGKKIRIAGSHLCHQFAKNRIVQLQDIVSFSEKESIPSIVMGDLNFDPKSEEYRSIPKNWIDAASIFDPRTNTYGSVNEGARIDYILADSHYFEVIDYKVLTVPYSDHFPVWAILKLKTP